MAKLLNQNVKQYQKSETNFYTSNDSTMFLTDLKEFGEKLTDIETVVY